MCPLRAPEGVLLGSQDGYHWDPRVGPLEGMGAPEDLGGPLGSMGPPGDPGEAHMGPARGRCWGPPERG